MSGAIAALAGGEVRRLFRSPLAWLVLALGAGFMALDFMLLVVRYLENAAALRSIGVTRAVLVPYFLAANLGALLAAPLLTMNAIAGERRDGTLRFLYTAPLGAVDIVAGKLLGVLTLALAYVLLVALIPVTLFWGAPIDPGIYLAN
ncbi:MAG: ABC transporter permease subunit, partial [Gammaproteobacteria bacterium]